MSRAVWVSALIAILLAAPATAQDEILTEWVEVNPFFEEDKLGLGYPVPFPVDTPLPFDGFRTYAGLHTRHQDLAATTPWVHPEEIGKTRNDRTIWAYRLGDADRVTPWGLPEPATLTNGGIHAREWQSPETVTGIMELLAGQAGDKHFYDYLLHHVNMIVIPSLNIDGFLQTQRYPNLNWVGGDPSVPDEWPRDGRMRRKNMLGVDEDLATLDDHLFGVDLNRNNPPYWDSTNGQRSSDDKKSLVYHGKEPQSEPEQRALDTAAELGPADQLRVYTDVHSFSQVHFWVRNDNDRLARQTEDVLGLFTQHHLAFGTNKYYWFRGRNDALLPRNQGIGATDSFFYEKYKVPAWTLEIEPSGGGDPSWPGSGADYGGTGVTHSGFILPDSEIRRVREHLAQSFASVYYRQSGPPHLQALRFVDQRTGAVVFEAEWDVLDERNRELFINQLQPMVLGRKYTIWFAFSKPISWLADGEPAAFPGQPFNLDLFDANVAVGAKPVDVILDDIDIGMEPGGAPNGYMRYKTDTIWADFSFQDSASNREDINGETVVNLALRAFDMVNMGLDADPSTVVYWDNGFWNAYEDSIGQETDFGGRDSSMNFLVTNEILDDPFVIEPGIAAIWFDPSHNGEGFVIEILADGRAVLYWFTYDGEGNQDWYIGVGEVAGNRLLFPELLRVSGGVFGPDFDPDLVEAEVVGSAKFLWSDCDNGTMDWHIGNARARQALVRLSGIMGLDCGPPQAGPISEFALLSGTWYDPTHNGEGYVVEVLADGRVVVYWFSFGPDGSRRWYFGIGEIIDGVLVFDEMLTTHGGIFGDDFDPQDVDILPWGSLDMAIDCDGGPASYASTEEGFGSGVLNVVKLSELAGLECGN
jgi:hypothetical protein